MDDIAIRKARECRINLTWTYEKIRPFLMTGDQVLFKGRGLLSWLICLLTGGDKSHIGTIIKVKNPENELGWLQLLESDYGKNIHGLQLSMLGEKIRTYKGEVYIRFLNCPRPPIWYQLLYQYIAEHRGSSYEKGIGGFWELLGAALRINKQNERRLFCSEASAGIFKNWGYLPKLIASNNYTPEDFDEWKKVDDYLREASLLARKAAMGEFEKSSIWLSPCQKIVRK